MKQPTFEDLVDQLYIVLTGVHPAGALSALCAAIMGKAGECGDPARAVLAAIAELSNLVRLMPDEGPSREKALPLHDWIEESWQ